MKFEDVRVGQSLIWWTYTYEVLFVGNTGAVIKSESNTEMWQQSIYFGSARVVKPKIKLYQIFWLSSYNHWFSYVSKSKAELEVIRTQLLAQSHCCTEIKEIEFDDPTISP